MGQPSRKLADCYGLRLSPAWQSWFDVDWREVQPAGAMRFILSAEDLCSESPPHIWAGFMLPDTLPLIGNEYGDWICVRVLPNGELDELIYWYHGGGDWIPLGRRLAEALLHDTVDPFRQVRSQMLRGAVETRAEEADEILSRFSEPQWRHWVQGQLVDATHSEAEISTVLQGIEGCLRAGDYRAAVELLYHQRWAEDAVACDLVELALQSPVESLADANIARELGIAWYPDYVRLLFDVSKTPRDLRDRILAKLNDQASDGREAVQWPEQDWPQAAQIAEQVIARRDDLGWAFTVAGWAQERSGCGARAAATYWQGKYASSFADQSVRLNSHSVSEESGKFAIEQLLNLQEHLPESQRRDPYLAIFSGDRQRSLLADVHEYWWAQAEQSRQAANFADAYDCFFRSGWDMGVSRLADYCQILEALADSARAMGWHAREAVANTHLRCLKHRMQ